jgi:hypothetical protein
MAMGQPTHSRRTQRDSAAGSWSTTPSATTTFTTSTDERRFYCYTDAVTRAVVDATRSGACQAMTQLRYCTPQGGRERHRPAAGRKRLPIPTILQERSGSQRVWYGNRVPAVRAGAPSPRTGGTFSSRSARKWPRWACPRSLGAEKKAQRGWTAFRIAV